VVEDRRFQEKTARFSPLLLAKAEAAPHMTDTGRATRKGDAAGFVALGMGNQCPK
jgi:hypothetical protein